MAGVIASATLAPGHPLSLGALVGTSPIRHGGESAVAPGIYDVIIPITIQLDGKEVRLTSVGPELRVT
ncbi:MAG: hypothetical protein ACYDD0_11130 [Candidatus Dormibacteria bacterium]